MADYQDTRSAAAQARNPYLNPEPEPATDLRDHLRTGGLAFLRWLALIAAITIGVRLAINWTLYDMGRAVDKATEEFKTKLETMPNPFK